jgi:hypothetical protein
MADLLARLHGVARSGEGWTARCPAHDDRHSSLSVHHRSGRWLLKCHAGCEWRDVVDALGLEAEALFDDWSGAGGRSIPPNNPATAQPLMRSSNGATGEMPQLPTASAPSRTGLTLDQYAVAKNIRAEFLRSIGLTEISLDRMTALRIPYLGIAGEELAVRFRVALDRDRFRWKSGSKPLLYGLHRIEDARKAGHVALVEGESDCHTLWFYGIPALGVPGAGNWREDRDAGHLDGIDTVYVVVEPDRGGDAVREWLARSSIRHRAKLVRLPTKDPSALHLEGSVQLGDAPAAGGPVHDAGADEIWPSSAEAAGHADDADRLVDVLPLAADAHPIGEMQPIVFGTHIGRGDLVAVARPLAAGH